MWISTQKRERPKKEVPEEPVMEELLREDTDFRNDNRSSFCWPVRRLYSQPNKDPAGYWSETK